MKKNGKVRVDWGFEGLLGSKGGCRPQVVASPLLAASRVARPQDADQARNGSLLVTKDGGMANQFRCGILEAGAAWRQDKGMIRALELTLSQGQSRRKMKEEREYKRRGIIR